MKIKICEIFNTIQGEGAWMGRPVTLVRFSGCNNKCPWCDTKYSWKEGKSLSESQLKNMINKEIKDTNRLLITGGEPLLQKEGIKFLLDNYEQVGLETSGIEILDNDMINKFDIITVAPKKHLKKDTLFEKWNNVNVHFKFVVGNGAWNFDEIVNIIKINNLDKDRIWIMPLTINGVFNKRLCQKIWNFCVENGFNYSDRLHVRVWDNERLK